MAFRNAILAAGDSVTVDGDDKIVESLHEEAADWATVKFTDGTSRQWDGFASFWEGDVRVGGLTKEDEAWLTEQLTERLADQEEDDGGPDVVMTSIGYVELFTDGTVVAFGRQIAVVDAD